MARSEILRVVGDYDENIAVKATDETVEAVEEYGDEIARGATEVPVETTDKTSSDDNVEETRY